MPIRHEVRTGECLSSLGQRYGLPWQTIWDHSDNAELKRRRGHPNILYPGDVVIIPDPSQAEQAKATDQRHRFRAKGTPARLVLRLLRNTEPLANHDYRLDVEGRLVEGTTDGDGWLEEPIPPDAEDATLILDSKGWEFTLALGHLDPIDEVSGVQARLANLGFDPGPIDGIVGPMTEAAIREFQAVHDLEVTGGLDDQTRQKIEKAHGS